MTTDAARPSPTGRRLRILVVLVALAIVFAQSVLLSTEMSLPAAIYGVLMFFIAAGFGFLIKRRAANNLTLAQEPAR